MQLYPDQPSECTTDPETLTDQLARLRTLYPALGRGHDYCSNCNGVNCGGCTDGSRHQPKEDMEAEELQVRLFIEVSNSEEFIDKLEALLVESAVSRKVAGMVLLNYWFTFE